MFQAINLVRMKKIYLIAFIALFAFPSLIIAQSTSMGEFHGSFQADASYYRNDSAINATDIPEHFGINAFFEARYTLKNIEAGVRYELFQPQLQGYDARWKGNGFGYRYIRYNGENIDVTAGNFYEQFGSGMILRSYQEWNLGFDNSLDGVRVKYKINGLILTGLVAKQRLYWNLGPGIVRGFDGDLSLNEFVKSFANLKTRINLGGSFVSRYQVDQDPLYVLPANVGAYAGRISLFRGGFNAKIEAAGKINDPNASNNMIYKNGNAVFAEFGYSKKGLGITFQANRSDNMDFRSNRSATGFDLPISYIPAMTYQHAYSLAALYPYASQPNGQMGFQTTVIYKLKKETLLGGKYGSSLSLNYSLSYAIDKQALNDTTPIGKSCTYGYKSNFFAVGDEKYYSDFNLKLQRKLSKKWDITLMYMNVYYNMLINEGHLEPNVHANIAIVDLWWKFKPYNSLHFEAQQLLTEQDRGNWTSVLLEYNRKGFFAALNTAYNHGIAGTAHEAAIYPMANLGYTHKGTRVALGYGRQVDGIVCIGGVCRAVPAASGFTLTLNSSF